jgi:hypothetical protein
MAVNVVTGEILFTATPMKPSGRGKKALNWDPNFAAMTHERSLLPGLPSLATSRGKIAEYLWDQELGKSRRRKLSGIIGACTDFGPRQRSCRTFFRRAAVVRTFRPVGLALAARATGQKQTERW